MPRTRAVVNTRAGVHRRLYPRSSASICGSQPFVEAVMALISITRTIAIDEAELHEEFRSRLGARRAERQPRQHRSPASLRCGAVAVAAGGCASAADRPRRQEDYRGGRAPHRGPPLPHPGSQPARRPRAPLHLDSRAATPLPGPAAAARPTLAARARRLAASAIAPPASASAAPPLPTSSARAQTQATCTSLRWTWRRNKMACARRAGV